jgi:hypothetical protein
MGSQVKIWLPFFKTIFKFKKMKMFDFVCKFPNCKNFDELTAILTSDQNFSIIDGKIFRCGTMDEMDARFKNSTCYLVYKF